MSEREATDLVTIEKRLMAAGARAYCGVMLKVAADPSESIAHPIHQTLAGFVTGDYGTVADLGCGAGQTLAAITDRTRHAQLIGIDLSAARLASAAGLLDGHRALLVQADLSQPLPLADACLDVVVCHNVIELLADPLALLRQVHRVLRPGGRAVLSHTDFAGLIVHGPDPHLTERVLRAYATIEQPWMRHIDAHAARRLPHLAVQAGLIIDGIRGHTVAEPGLRGQAHRRIDEITTVAGRHINCGRTTAISSSDIEQWHQQIKSCAEDQSLLFAESALITTAHRR